jgi:hypothetical protein
VLGTAGALARARGAGAWVGGASAWASFLSTRDGVAACMGALSNWPVYRIRSVHVRGY